MPSSSSSPLPYPPQLKGNPMGEIHGRETCLSVRPRPSTYGLPRACLRAPRCCLHRAPAPACGSLRQPAGRRVPTDTGQRSSPLALRAVRDLDSSWFADWLGLAMRAIARWSQQHAARASCLWQSLARTESRDTGRGTEYWVLARR